MADDPHNRYVPDLPNLDVLERRYEFIRELGRGGMAAVHLVRDRDTGDRVALKAICRRYAEDEESLARFAREARTLAMLSHPNIVQTLRIETVEARTIAIVMEYMHGRTLRALLREQPRLSIEAAAAILRDIASALAHAHALGVVHRDVKPDNIFLDETTGRARLADFGIARGLESDVDITLTGMALGTPAYMSPEQIDGVPLDGRSDIYGLGVVGWEMLAGARPWDGESLYGMIYRQKHDHLADLALLRDDIPAALLDAIDGALRKQAHERWSAEEFLEVLHGGLATPRHELLPGRASEPNDFATLRFRRLERTEDAGTREERRLEPSAVRRDESEWSRRVAPALAWFSKTWASLRATPALAFHRSPAPDRSSAPRHSPAPQPEPTAEADLDTTPEPATATVAAAEPTLAGGARPDDADSAWGDALSWPMAPWGDTAENSARSFTEPDDVGSAPWDVSYPHEMMEPPPRVPSRPLALAAFVLMATLGAGAISERRTSEDHRALLASASSGSLGMTSLSGLGADDRRPVAALRARRDSLAACNRPELDQQRICAEMLTASADADVAIAFNALVERVAASGAVRAGSAPDTLRRLRVVQRAWQIERDLECAERFPERDGERWAFPRSECIASITAERTEELRSQVRGSTARARR